MANALLLKDRIYVSRDEMYAGPDMMGRPVKYKNWDQHKISLACDAVCAGQSIRRAAEEYGIPRSTLHDHITGKIKPGAKSGPRRYLNSTEELDLVNFLTGVSSLGYSRTTKQIVQIVQEVVNKKGLNVTVSSSWWQSFHSRHEELTLRNPETLTHVRIAGASTALLDNYFNLLETTLKESELEEQPCQIFNLDESGFPLNPKPPKVANCKGEKQPVCTTSNEKSQITVLSCASAGGYAIPPFVIFNRKALRPEMTIGEVPGTMYGLSGSGWMDSEIFENWFTNHFLLYAPPSRPLLLLMDGHSSHFSPVFVNRAAEEEVIVFCLPPHSTHKHNLLIKTLGP
jgi:hypothetical protein